METKEDFRMTLQRLRHRPFIIAPVALLLGLLVISSVTPTLAQDAAGFFEDFESYPKGTAAEDIAIPGATLSSPFIPRTWIVILDGSDFITLHGNIFTHAACSAALVVELEKPATEVSFRFGIDPSVEVLKVDGWLGEPGPGTLEFSRDYYGAFLGAPNGWREGRASNFRQEFDHLVIYSPGGCMAIDELYVGPE